MPLPDPPADRRPILLPMPAAAAASSTSSLDVPGTEHPLIVSSGRSLPPGHKRTRILLSCGPCRLSKQKCDRQQPCTNCIKKSREGLCTYAPKPEKIKPERSMAARLRRLEGMVREMMYTQTQESTADLTVPTETVSSGRQQQIQEHVNGASTAPPPARTVLTATRPGTGEAAAEEEEDEEPPAQVVVGKGGQGTYVAATHFMAMLDDIEDLKSYFDNDEETTPENSSAAGGQGGGTSIGMWSTPARSSGSPDGPQRSYYSHSSSSPEMLFYSGNTPTSKQELVDMLPPRHVVDRLIQRYFSACSPSHHCVHRPTFGKQYDAFWRDPGTASTHWLALLWIILALGTLLSSFTAPHELEADSDMPPMERFRRYRGAALHALTAGGGFSSPSHTTLQATILFVESEFLVNRKSQMNCYLLTSVCVRMMLRMGLHRDASKLPQISPFDGEMRRRMWHVACQFDLLVSFHLGLPSMVDRIESDTSLPQNLIDSDFDTISPSLPPPRPDSEYTPLTYPIWKSYMCQVFALVANQANSLTNPTYAEVMALDRKIEARWAQVPSFMRQVRPPENQISDSPNMLNQRFGLVSLYQKSRCVLHRRYLLAPSSSSPTKPDEDRVYSRRTCIQAAVALLDYQEFMHLATQPGGALRSSGWFITPLALHDFLLAAMVICLVLLNEEIDYSGGTSELPDRKRLFEILEKSHRTWVVIARDDSVSVKAAETIEVMLRKLRARKKDGKGEEDESPWQIVGGGEPVSVGTLSVSDEPWDSEMNLGLADQTQVPLSRQDLVPSSGGFDAGWLDVNMGTEEMNWKSFDDAISGQNNNIVPQDVEGWIEQGPLFPDVSLMASFGLQGPFV